MPLFFDTEIQRALSPNLVCNLLDQLLQVCFHFLCQLLLLLVSSGWDDSPSGLCCSGTNSLCPKRIKTLRTNQKTRTLEFQFIKPLKNNRKINRDQSLTEIWGNKDDKNSGTIKKKEDLASLRFNQNQDKTEKMN